VGEVLGRSLTFRLRGLADVVSGFRAEEGVEVGGGKATSPGVLAAAWGFGVGVGEVLGRLLTTRLRGTADAAALFL